MRNINDKFTIVFMEISKRAKCVSSYFYHYKLWRLYSNSYDGLHNEHDDNLRDL